MADTDRELLELAAKAAGIAAEWHHYPSTSRGAYYVLSGSISEEGPLFSPWNPLTNDGDALRLAVKLRMDVDVDGNSAWAMAESDSGSGCVEYLGSDPCAATRRAIVRAAAAIGQAMDGSEGRELMEGSDG